MRRIRRGKHSAPAPSAGVSCLQVNLAGVDARILARGLALALVVEVAHPILDRRLPLLRARRDVLDKAPRTDAQLLGHPHRLVRQPAAPLRFGPELLLVQLLQLHAHQLLPNYLTIPHGMIAGPWAAWLSGHTGSLTRTHGSIPDITIIGRDLCRIRLAATQGFSPCSATAWVCND